MAWDSGKSGKTNSHRSIQKEEEDLMRVKLEDGKNSDTHRSIQKEAEDLNLALTSSRPTDLQVSDAKEEDQAIKDLATAKGEVAASRSSSTTAEERLEALRAIRSGKVGHVGEEAYQQAMAEIVRGSGNGQKVPAACKGPPAAAISAGQE
eukprot:3726595-Heterocapsa_arctica.AAC.1